MKDGTIIKGGKGSMPDAGNRVPFIANWPGTINPDQVRQEIVDLFDIIPTLCDAAGYEIPANLNIDGRSIYPLLTASNYEQRGYTCGTLATVVSKGQEFTRDQKSHDLW